MAKVDGVRVFEARGVWASAGDKKGWIRLFERGTGIDLVKDYETPQLTAAEAKRLADHLYELVNKIETSA